MICGQWVFVVYALKADTNVMFVSKLKYLLTYLLTGDVDLKVAVAGLREYQRV